MLNRDDLIIKVATLFYEADLTQTEIAKRLKISRPTVSHLLKEAKDKGIVRISIQHSKMNITKMQSEIALKYNLKNVLISPKSHGTLLDKNLVGSLCAEFIEQIAPTISSLGIGWGTTMYEFVQSASYTNFSDLEIIPLMGGFGISDVKFHSNHLAFQLAEKYNCSVVYFYAPAFAESIEVKHTFESTNLVQEIYKKGKSVDLAITGVGNPAKTSTYQRLGYISTEEKEKIKSSTIIGDVLATLFDRDGNSVSTPISDRMMGMTLEDLEMVKEVLVVASGEEKIISVEALLNKGFIDYLIIDEEIANGLV
ncbi:deoxyribonucleoside regulator [Halolactibacillus halophilus]|uniref:Deoxyribonucleoside regulator n=1 Tax=Halolactibacillus halophilus TaxID=306540 RepID=A0A1I5R3S0_9BACI|nr:sugar-binding transcriptional regulator [Halolactibacillus halophilus]GEM02719.1 transcriptional regulator [Halolactibacillus halophilus]SFP53153.1 deoxyribonucleoside regulator [Halolactibacillus halophilus]